MRVRFKNFSWGLLVVVLLSLVPLASLLPSGFPITHDGQDHIARIANFYSSLSEGNIIPRWAENLNWGYGHPVIMFLYPLPSYFASLFHFLGFNLTDSVKLVFASAYIASGVAMYFWAKNQFDEYVGIASAALYMYAPYRFVDLYVRGAVGEHVAFAFLPLVLYSTYKLYSSKNSLFEYLFFALTILSISFLILSHNALSIMFLPAIFAYSIFLSFAFSNWKKFFYFLLALCLGFLLTSFFIIPAFIEGKYTLRDIVTGNEYKARFVEPIRLFVSRWNYGISGQFSVEIGYLHLLGVALSPLVLLKLRKKGRKTAVLLLGLIMSLIISIFLVLPISNFFYETFTTLKKFQFPWRFLSLTVFSSSVIASLVLFLAKKKQTKKAFLFVFILLLLLTSYEKWHANGHLIKPDSFYKSVYSGTTDTGESSPIWSIRFMEIKPRAHSEVVEGEGVINEVLRTSTSHKYLVAITSETAKIKENTLYFPGWKVIGNGEEIRNIEYQDPAHRGLMTYVVNKGTHDIEVKFEDTRLRKFSNYLPLLAIVIMAGIFIIKTRKW